jgi:peptidoglycan-associated lipoprotein
MKEKKNMVRTSAVSALALALVAILPACASKPETKPSEGPKRSFAQQHPSVPNEPPTPTTTSVRISDEIVRACGIADPDSYFAFDSARLNGDDTRVLNQIAKCFVSGPLEGRKLKLVGRADPRGAEEYNMTLGQHRADSVMKYLETRRLAKPMMASTSRGEMDAVGNDEPSWAHDRRVDILLD